MSFVSLRVIAWTFFWLGVASFLLAFWIAWLTWHLVRTVRQVQADSDTLEPAEEAMIPFPGIYDIHDEVDLIVEALEQQGKTL